jgi:hypothetical protein
MFGYKSLRNGVGALALTALIAMSASGCWVLFDNGPAEVTRDFWDAARDGNQEMVEALSVNRRGDFDFDFDDEDSEIRSISIGETEIDGDEAEVETVIEGVAEDRDITLEFRTALVREDGDWFVEMDETTGRLVGAVVQAMAGELGEAITRGLGEAMQGVSEGLEEAGRALQEAAEEMREERERNDR